MITKDDYALVVQHFFFPSFFAGYLGYYCPVLIEPIGKINNNNKLNPHDIKSRNQTQATLVGDKCSIHLEICFTYREARSIYNLTRKRTMLRQPSFNPTWMKNSFICQFCKLWNNLSLKLEKCKKNKELINHAF